MVLFLSFIMVYMRLFRCKLIIRSSICFLLCFLMLNLLILCMFLNNVFIIKDVLCFGVCCNNCRGLELCFFFDSILNCLLFCMFGKGKI